MSIRTYIVQNGSFKNKVCTDTLIKGDHVTQRTVYLDCEMHHALYEKWEICENWIGTVTIMNSHLYPSALP